MGFNIPQNFAFSMSYELPFGRGKRFLTDANKFENAVLGGWQVQNITVLRSGLPYTPIISRDVANTGVGLQRPIQGWQSTTEPSNAFAVVQSEGLCVAGPIHVWHIEGVLLQGDMYRQYDVSVFKSFPITEGSNLQFRAEFFNLPNVTSFNPPSLAANSTAAPSAAVDTATGAEILSTSTNPRQIQFALKFNF